MARTTICTCSGATAPARCAAAKLGNTGPTDSPSFEVCGPNAAAARTRAAASLGDSNNIRVNNMAQAGEAILTSQIMSFRIRNQTVVDQRQPVPERFEPPPKADLPRSAELIKTAGFNRVDQTIERSVEDVQRHIELGAFRALTC